MKFSPQGIGAAGARWCLERHHPAATDWIIGLMLIKTTP